MDKTKLDEIKGEMCDGFCKHLDRANRARFEQPEDIDKLADLMHDICANCPLNKLRGDKHV